MANLIVFYQFASLTVLSAAAAVRAAWSTVNNWRFWYDFLHTVFQVGSDYSVTSNDNIWDADPFAFNLHRFSRGIVFGTSVDVFSCIKNIYSDFSVLPPDDPYVKKIQQHISVPIKRFFYNSNTLDRLSVKAAKQKILLTPDQISEALKDLSSEPFILSATFHKVLTNALCTTSRIKNHPTLYCFACGKSRDDLFHFLRCPHVGFIFPLPHAFGSVHKPYFSVSNVAKLAVFF